MRDPTRDAATEVADRTGRQSVAVSPTPDPAPPSPPGAPPWPGLAAAAERAGLTLSPEQIDRYARYRDLLLDRRQRVNLTAITDPNVIERRLFFDALLMLPAIDVAFAKPPPPGGGQVRLVDVGSGAGFPGLVLAIARPAWRVTLLEATGKKVAFLDEVIEALGLPGVTTIHARAEETGRDLDHRGQYDLATARGVASLPTLLELCAPLLRRNGIMLFPKGMTITDELAAARRATSPLGVRIVATDPLPGAETETRLIVVRKSASTPDRFPRRAGLPVHEPLGGVARGRRTAVGGGTPPANPQVEVAR